MTTPIDPPATAAAPGAGPALGGATPPRGGATPTEPSTETVVAERPGLGGWMTALLLVAYAGTFMALVTPQAFSLAIRIQQIDPAARDTALPLAIGIPAALILLTGPLTGVLSDRSRSRFGRRRPFLITGAAIGLLGSVAVALSPSIGLVVAAWTVGYAGYALVGGMITAHLGDRLPAAQRGRISGATGALTQIAPVIGVVTSGALVSTPALMFLVPATVAFVTAVVFAVRMRDEPAQGEAPDVDVKGLLKGFYFDPRQLPDLGWVVLSRFFVFLAIGFTTVYALYFLGERLAVDPETAAGLIAAVSVGSVATAIVGALLCGFLSDRLKRRKPFLVGAALILGGALLATSGVTSTWQYVAAALATTFAIGAYSAVDQATALDVIPTTDGENGRYLAIVALGNQLPQAVGPFVAGAVVATAAGGYGLVYVVASVAALAGAIAILPLRVSRAAGANAATAAADLRS